MMEAYVSTQSFQSLSEKTFEHDERLPSLPVPQLQQTLKKYLESVRPHVSDEEYERTARLARDFEQGVGQDLHRKLVKRAVTKRNWLEDWWFSYAYLQLRDPISPLMNFGGAASYYLHCWPPMEGTQIERCALAVYFMLKHWQLLRLEKLVIDRGAQGREPWSMNQFRRLYNTCRIPGLKEDKIISYFKTEAEGPIPKHVIVTCRGRLFKLNAINAGAAEDPLAPPELQRQLQAIHRRCNAEARGPGIAALTGAPRSRWYELREQLLQKHSNHAKLLEVIQSSIAVVALEDSSPAGFCAVTQEAHLSTTGNLWYDKSLNFVSYANGTFAVNCDHAPMDAMTMVNMSYFVDCSLKECNGIWQGSATSVFSASPEELVFTLDSDLTAAISREARLHHAQCQNVEIKTPIFGHFGKNYIRRHGLHPDAFVQVALQCAYYRLHKKPAPTYETATTRRFYNARTETLRSCTSEAIALARALIDPSVLSQRRLQLLKQAIQKHASLMSEAANGLGCDRHLLGMWIIAHEEGLPVPALYTDSSYTKSGGGGNYILSTSFIGYTTVQGGVAPMCRNGYGFFYRISPARITFFISTWNEDKETDAMKLYESMKATLMEFKVLLDTTTSSNM